MMLCDAAEVREATLSIPTSKIGTVVSFAEVCMVRQKCEAKPYISAAKAKEINISQRNDGYGWASMYYVACVTGGRERRA